MPKHLSERSKSIVLNVCKFFDREKQKNQNVIPLSASRERARLALGISSTSIRSIKKEYQQNGFVSSPIKTRTRARVVRDIDEFHQSAIRSTVYDMYREKKFVTCATLAQELQNRNLFFGSRGSLLRILHDIGFVFKTESSRRILVDSENIAIARFKFLEKYMQNKKSENPLDVVFMDETCIFEKGSSQESGKGKAGKRLIIIQAGNKNGFIEEADLIFAAKQITGDFHEELNAENYTEWLQTQLLPSLQKPSLIIIDNASYHNKILNPVPTIESDKETIKKWLRDNDIPFSDRDFKYNLLDLVRRHKLAQKKYSIDNIFEENGHKVLRLPPFHSQYNAIDSIWTICKSYYNENIVIDGVTQNAVDTWQKAIDNISPDQWTNTISQIDHIIEEAWNEEVAIDMGEMEPIIIAIGNEKSSDEDSSD